MKFRVAGLIIAFACVASLAFAQQPLRLQITSGRVTLHAQNVMVRTILDEWARLGGAKVINGERITGAPVTLDLENVPERQALDIILRGVSGYMLAARSSGAAGASMYDRIMILPTSVAPRNPPPAAAAPVFNQPPQGGIPRAPVVRPGVIPGDGDDAADDNNDGVPLARPVGIPNARPPFTGVQGVPVGAPVIPPAPVLPQQEQQAPPAVTTSPTNPFGLPAGSSARPGVVTPAPPQQAVPQGAQQQRNTQD